MKANSGKSHLLMRCIETHANIDDFMTKSTQKEILLRVNLDRELEFEDHVSFMCKKSKPKTLCACPNCTIHGSKTEETHHESIC